MMHCPLIQGLSGNYMIKWLNETGIAGVVQPCRILGICTGWESVPGIVWSR